MPDAYIDSNSLQDDSDATWNSSTLSFLNSAAYLAGTPAVDDELWYASDHSGSYTSATTLQFKDGTKLISVNSSTDAYEAGAEEHTTGVYDLTLNPLAQSDIVYIDGVDFSSGDDLFLSGDLRTTYLSNLTLSLTGGSASDRIFVYNDGNNYFLNDVVFNFSYISQSIEMANNARLVIEGGSTNNTNAFIETIGAGGQIAHIKNFDFSSMTGGYIFEASPSTMDNTVFTLERCKVPAAVSITDGAIGFKGVYVDAWSIDSGDGYHYFEHHRHEGVALEDTTIYRDGGSHYDGDNPTTTNFSAEFLPNANVVPYTQPLRIKILERELDLTGANILTFHIALGDTSTITAADVKNNLYWIEIVQNSDTASSKALGITINTKPASILATPTALANASTTWTWPSPPTDTKEFQIPVTTTVVSGATKGQVTAYLCVAEYISTRQIFACLDPVIT